MRENTKTKLIFVGNKSGAFDQMLPVVLQRYFNNAMIQNYQYFGEKKYNIINILERKNTTLSIFWREKNPELSTRRCHQHTKHSTVAKNRISTCA